MWTPGVGDGQGGLACCNSWGLKESDTTERLKWLTDRFPLVLENKSMIHAIPYVSDKMVRVYFMSISMNISNTSHFCSISHQGKNIKIDLLGQLQEKNPWLVFRFDMGDESTLCQPWQEWLFEQGFQRFWIGLIGFLFLLKVSKLCLFAPTNTRYFQLVI